MSNLKIDLQTLDFLIKRELTKPGAAPIIGLAEISKADERVGLVVSFLAGHPMKLTLAFDTYPYATAWAVTRIIRRTYGSEDTHAIYPPLSKGLGISLDANGLSRAELRRGFEKVCGKLGILVDSDESNFELYMSQTGVPDGMLHHIAAAFMRQQRYFGSPPIEDSRALHEWELGALDFLQAGVRSPRFPIERDQTGWHAQLFARLQADAESSRSAFAGAFSAAIEHARKGASGGEAFAIPKPKLRWDGEALVLDIPPLDSRLHLRADADQPVLRLSSSRPWQLPDPWPTQLSWQVGTLGSKMSVVAEPGMVAIFERTSGKLLRQIVAARQVESIDASDIVVLSRSPISVGGEESYQIGEKAWCCPMELKPGRTSLIIGATEMSLARRPQRRIGIEGPSLASGAQGPLFGAGCRLRIETGQAVAESRTIQLHGIAGAISLEVAFDETGVGVLELDEALLAMAKLSEPLAEPFRLRVELPLHGRGLDGGGSGSTYTAAFWIWPWARFSENRMSFIAPHPPETFRYDRARHVGRDDQGQLCLDRQGGYARARLSFETVGGTVDFEVPWPGISIVHRRIDGQEQLIPIGGQVLLRHEDRFDAIVVRCTDPKAGLVVRGQHERQSFARMPSRSLPLRELMRSAPNDRVVLRSGSGAETLLFRVVETVAPTVFEPRLQAGSLRLRIAMPKRFDAIALDLEDETGVRSRAEVALGHIPTEMPPPFWLVATLDPKAATGAELAIDTSQVSEGLHLGLLSLRASDGSGWKRISNPRGDTFAVLFKGSSDLPDAGLAHRFKVLTSWLCLCLANESWQQGGKLLTNSWRALGERLSRQPNGNAVLLEASLIGPTPDCSPSWVPLLHPLALVPDLYEAAPVQFSGLSRSDLEGGPALALIADVSLGRVRELEALSEAALLGFANAHAADRTGARLEGFNVAHFMAMLSHPHLDHDPGAGMLWRGRPLLGPGHWRAAHLRFKERIEAAGLFVDDDADKVRPNGLRQLSLQRMMKAAHDLATRSNFLPPIPRRIAKFELSSSEAGDDILDRWAAAALGGFAEAARSGMTVAWIARLSAASGQNRQEVLSALSLLIRLAPELFAFYLAAWQLHFRDKSLQPA